METFLNLIISPVGIGLCVFILLITLVSGWTLYSWTAIKRGEESEYLTEKMKKKYYDEFMFKIGKEVTMKEEKYSIYLIKLLGKCIIMLLLMAFYIILGLALAIGMVKYYLWIGLVIGFTYWILRKIVKKFKITKHEELKLVGECG